MCLGLANGGKQPAEMTENEIYPPLKNITLEQAYEDYVKTAEEMKDTLLDEIDKLHTEIERLIYIITRDNQRQTEKEQKYGNCILDLYDLYDNSVEDNKKLNAEIENQRADKIRLIEHFNEREKEIIKEFADRLKEHLKGNGGLYCVTTMNAQIDNLVKEMAGADNV